MTTPEEYEAEIDRLSAALDLEAKARKAAADWVVDWAVVGWAVTGKAVRVDRRHRRTRQRQASAPTKRQAALSCCTICMTGGFCWLVGQAIWFFP